MEKYKCKLCLRSFTNGKALGGHMRSHMLNLYVPPKPKQQLDDQLSENTELASSPPSSSDEQNQEDKALLSYLLRENPKKSVRLVDPELSFTVDAGSSMVLQDRESECESSKNLTRRRSKRVRKETFNQNQYHNLHFTEPEMKKRELGKKIDSSFVEPEPVSSISDTTPEEDVAYCLMMLSRDNWMREEECEAKHENHQTSVIAGSKDSKENNKVRKTRVRGKYKCETCNIVFRSYQALGGHRASHKKIKSNNGFFNFTEKEQAMEERENGNGTSKVVEEKVHQCPVCDRVFSSGQALGGHKRSHVMGSAITTTTITISNKPVTKFVETLIDLNLPAPVDDDDEISQFEFSAVSDAEFVNPNKQ